MAGEGFTYGRHEKRDETRVVAFSNAIAQVGTMVVFTGSRESVMRQYQAEETRTYSLDTVAALSSGKNGQFR
jgi:hypothetical protein